jgi:hypothetical protein
VKGLNFNEKVQCEFMNQKTGNLEVRECYLFWTYTIVSYRKIGENATQFTSLNSNIHSINIVFSTNGWGNLLHDMLGVKVLVEKRGEKQVELITNAMEKSDEKASLDNLNEKDVGNHLVSKLEIREMDQKFEENLLKLEEDVRKKLRESLKENRINHNKGFEDRLSKINQ